MANSSSKFLLPSVFLVTLAFNFFVFKTDFGLGHGLFNLVFVACLLFSFEHSRRNLYTWALGLGSIVLGLLLGFRASGMVQGVNFLVMLAFNFSLLVALSFDKIKPALWWLAGAIPVYALRLFPQPFLLLASTTLGNNEKGKLASAVSSAKFVASFVKTLIVTFGLLFVFTVIFAIADPVFAKLFTNLSMELVVRVIASIVVAVATATILSMRIESDEETKTPTLSFLSFWEFTIPVIALGILFAIFLSIQVNYLFASDSAFKALNITFSEYVRKGFAELLIATLMGSAVCYAIYLKLKASVDHPKAFILKITGVTLLSELLLILLSAQRRNTMYIEAHGLTRIRILGEFILVWIAIFMLFLFALTIVKKFKERYLLAGMAVATFVLCMTMNLVNIDLLIAGNPPTKEGGKDYFYVANLSEDVFPAWEPLMIEATKEFEEIEKKGKNPISLTDVNRLANIKLTMLTIAEKAKAMKSRAESKSQIQNPYFNFNLAKFNAYSTTGRNKDLETLFTETSVGTAKTVAEFRGIPLGFTDEDYRLVYEFDYPLLTITLKSLWFKCEVNRIGNHCWYW